METGVVGTLEQNQQRRNYGSVWKMYGISEFNVVLYKLGNRVLSSYEVFY